MNFRDIVTAIQELEEHRNIERDVIAEALEESLVKAYRREIGVPDALVEIVIDEDSEEMRLFHKFLVVETVEDDELEVGVDEIEEKLPIGEYYRVEEPIADLGRAAVTLAKNVIKQKLREAEKQAIYDEYIDQLGEMIMAMVESVEEKFVVVNLGKYLAVMPRSAQIEGENYREGQTLKVVITDVNRDTKGAQILVSRADSMLVRRLFETEVPEIFDGQVEIKAIAREAGDRTKMAVYSHDPDIDAIGACIGPRGSRVQEVIEELNGEKIDIFEWSENMVELVRNALAPAEVLAVYPNEDNKGLIVVVADDQLSLAIGKRGKNARLAVRLTKQRIDIKSASDLDGENIDYMSKMTEYLESLEKVEEVVVEVEPVVDASVETIEETEIVLNDERPEEIVEFEEVIAPEVEDIEEDIVEEKVVEEAIEEKEEVEFAPAVELEDEGIVIEREDVFRPRTDYVSKFEKLADASKQDEDQRGGRGRKKRRFDEPVSTSELLKEKEYEIVPEYSDDELEEIRKRQEEEESSWYEEEIDFDLFDEFYDEE
ncbi:transcription termination factor NusA [Erysipelothrix urinaevulpis]|uniref:transcription termination factor NusA n=1 Tax=Erysipelothrix urinaevulpis TaxID=2683717 RepID=UPI0013584847|nr:transcription termination factor NusA [Erysipelothrix urinaevulpis]